jgi:hypothetical protein
MSKNKNMRGGANSPASTFQSPNSSTKQRPVANLPLDMLGKILPDLNSIFTQARLNTYYRELITTKPNLVNLIGTIYHNLPDNNNDKNFIEFLRTNQNRFNDLELEEIIILHKLFNSFPSNYKSILNQIYIIDNNKKYNEFISFFINNIKLINRVQYFQSKIFSLNTFDDLDKLIIDFNKLKIVGFEDNYITMKLCLLKHTKLNKDALIHAIYFKKFYNEIINEYIIFTMLDFKTKSQPYFYFIRNHNNNINNEQQSTIESQNSLIEKLRKKTQNEQERILINFRDLINYTVDYFIDVPEILNFVIELKENQQELIGLCIETINIGLLALYKFNKIPRHFNDDSEEIEDEIERSLLDIIKNGKNKLHINRFDEYINQFDQYMVRIGKYMDKDKIIEREYNKLPIDRYQKFKDYF